MARLTAAQRNALPDSDFAGPGRSYPIEDASHARAAKRLEHNASPAERKKINAKVSKRYPKIGKPSPRMAAIAALAASRDPDNDGD